MTTNKLCLLTLCATLVSTGAMLVPGAAAAQTCEGDCNGDRSVTVDEIILGVGIVLGDASIRDCQAMDGDSDGAVTVNELLTAVTQALQGCGGTFDEAALAASTRVATEPILRLFDFQAHVGASRGVAGHSSVSGCQQFDCIASGHVTGTEEDCCLGTQFTRIFSDCEFDDDLGMVVDLNGAFVLDSDNIDVCTGKIPAGASFTASLTSFTHDVFFPDGGFSRTFQELTETFTAAPGGCTVSQPDPFGFGIRGDGRRSIDGELQQFQSDGFGHVLVDSESDIHGLEIGFGSMQEADGCRAAAALNGSLTSADFRVGTLFSTVFTDFHIVQAPQAGALLLGFNGTVDTDCLGPVTLSTIEPLRITPGDTCFSAGRLEAQLEAGRVSATYVASGLDLDFGADGNVDRHFAACTDVPPDPCRTKLVGLCGACTAADQCQMGLSCFPCSRNCPGNTRRCSLGDTFATCEDGVF